MTNRRDFIRNASLLAAGGFFAGKAGSVAASDPAAHKAMAGKSFGLQTYSLGNELGEDVAGGLKKVKSYGYSYLELAGYNSGRIGRLPMAEFKKLADDAGLEIRCSHLSPPVRGPYSAENRPQIAEFWKKAVDEHAGIGVKMLVQPSQPSTRNIPEVKYVCEVFNEVGKICKDAGTSWGYHNHNYEFAWVSPDSEEHVFGRRPRVPGQPGQQQQQQPSPWVLIEDIFIANTDPSLVFFELDVYWTIMGLQDPLEWMQNHASRIKALHIKDKAVLGQSGMMNFENIFNQAYKNGIEHYFVEIEGVRNMTQFESAKGCADYLLNAPFVK